MQPIDRNRNDNAGATDLFKQGCRLVFQSSGTPSKITSHPRCIAPSLFTRSSLCTRAQRLVKSTLKDLSSQRWYYLWSSPTLSST
eukprot:14651397-Ditylum_brightwellii.AAC.2